MKDSNNNLVRSMPQSVQSVTDSWLKRDRKNLKFFSWYGSGTLLLIMGFLNLWRGLNMDTTIPSDLGIGRTHNIGLISEREATTNAGGALAICGTIIVTRPRNNQKEAKAKNS